MSTAPTSKSKPTRAAAGLPVNIPPDVALQRAAEIRDKLQRGAKRLAELSEEQLAIATAPKDEVWREDMVRLYRYRPTVESRAADQVLIAYALVGRYQMIDLEAERSFVRKLLAEGSHVYMVDWGEPRHARIAG